MEFQRDRAKSIDSYCQLRSYSLQSDSLNLPVEAKISVKASQLLKFAIQAIRGMVSAIMYQTKLSESCYKVQLCLIYKLCVYSKHFP